MQLKVISSYRDATLTDDPAIIAELQRNRYRPVTDAILTDISNKKLPGNTAIVLSGSWNYTDSVVYFEDKMYKNLPLEYHSNTLFIDMGYKNLFEKVIGGNTFANLIFIHSPFFNYKTPEKILEKIEYLKTISQSQILVAQPIMFIDFNRLKYSAKQLSILLQGDVIDHSIIIKS